MSTNQWMDKEYVVHIYNGLLLSHKKNEIMPFAATWMDLEIIILSEVTQRKTNIIWYRLYVESKKRYKWTNLQSIKSHRCRKQTYGYWGGRARGINWEIEIDIYTLLYIKQITNKDLLYSTVNSTQYSVMAYMGKESKKEWIYVHV